MSGVNSVDVLAKKQDIDLDADKFIAKTNLFSEILKKAREKTNQTDAAKFQSPFLIDPEQMIMDFFSKMKTEDIINLIRTDEYLSYVFMGGVKPKKDDPGVVEDEVTPTSRLMLLLLEREYGLTNNRKKCMCSFQFSQAAAESFTDWLKSTQPESEQFDYENKETIAAVKALLFKILYGPPPTTNTFFVAGGIMFRYLENKIQWVPYINHYAKKAVGTDLRYWTESGERFNFKDAQLLTITAAKTVRGVVTQLLINFGDLQLKTYKIIMHIADRAGPTEEKYGPGDSPFAPSIFRRRYDSAERLTRYIEGKLSFLNNAETEKVFQVRDLDLNYVDYESFAVVAKKDRFVVAIAYRYVPKDLDRDPHPQFLGLDFSPLIRQRSLEFLGFIRMDKKNGTQKFVLAIVFKRIAVEGEKTDSLSFHIVRARDDDSLYYSGTFNLSGPMVEFFSIPPLNRALKTYRISDAEIKFPIKTNFRGVANNSLQEITINVDSENAIGKKYSVPTDAPPYEGWYYDTFQEQWKERATFQSTEYYT
jgi:hypothetical protein